MSAPASPDAREVIAFWRAAGPRKWFAKDAAFDVDFRDRFAHLYSQASRAELVSWRNTAEGALAEILLLDQFPRNVFRGTPWMFATDALAREAARALIASGQDVALAQDLHPVAYLPFTHSEAVEDQDRCVALMTPLGESYAHHANEHRKVIIRFGRFPHRNTILGRINTPDEQAFIDGGGYSP
jgi:uncharacterized protein (DUF924 family)